MKGNKVKAVAIDRAGWFAAAAFSALAFLLTVASLALGGGVSYRVATDNAGSQANGSSSGATSSIDGRYIVFESSATNLVPGDGNGVTDIFFKDTDNGLITRISTDSAGNEVYGANTAAKMTPDARYVVFQSPSDSLVAGDTNGVTDIYLKTVATGAIERVSVSTAGAQANGVSDLPTVSADGRYVAFRSTATNLVTGDTNGVADVFVRDVQSDTTTRVSTDSAGAQANGLSGFTYGAWIAAGGNHVVFESEATNLVAGDTNGAKDIFVKNLATGATTRVSTDALGNQTNGGSFFPTISADGRYVAFRSIASNLVAGDTVMCGALNCSDVFAKDTLSGQVYWVSTDAAGVAANASSWDPVISADGRFVAYSSNAGNIVPGDTNGTYDVFVRGTTGGPVELVSKNTATGTAGNNWSIGPMLSYGGGYVAFYSSADNLVPGDTNGASEVFLSPNELACPPASPGLTLTFTSVYWASYDDYTDRLLSVDYAISNPSSDPLLAVEIDGSLATSGVALATPTPVAVGDVNAGAAASLTLRYSVPQGVSNFKTTVYVNGTDGCGGNHIYPGPYPAT
ncbi:MAG: TolB family protein [Thermoleophilia bacterium]